MINRLVGKCKGKQRARDSNSNSDGEPSLKVKKNKHCTAVLSAISSLREEVLKRKCVRELLAVSPAN